jgi:hypothetical protein
MWGRWGPYQFSIIYIQAENKFIIQTSVVLSEPADVAFVNTALSGLKAAKTFQTYKFEAGTLIVTKRKSIRALTSMELETILAQLTEILEQADAKPACMNCQIEGFHPYANLNGSVVAICPECYNAVQEGILQAHQEYQESESNYGLGAIGAFLGGLAGSIVWVIIGLFGYVASISGFVIVMASAKGYSFFRGKMNKTALFIIFVASLMALVIAQFLTWDLLFYKEMQAMGYDIGIIDALKLTFKIPFIDSEITSAFIKDLALGGLFALLGSVGMLRNLAVKVAEPVGSIRRLPEYVS